MNKTDLAILVDAYAAKRSERLSAANLATNLEKEEKALQATLIAAYKEGKINDSRGKTYRVLITPEIKPLAADWIKIWNWVFKTKSNDIVQRRLTETAVKARWDDGVEIPGVDHNPVDKVTVLKL
jgi:hypothetical protein